MRQTSSGPGRIRECPALFGVRGGYGSAQIVLSLDPGTIRATPKSFVGYSDLTTLLTWLVGYCGVVAFHGPTVSGRLGRGPAAYDRASLLSALTVAAPMGELTLDGGETLVAGEVTGRLLGGTLTQLAAAQGTAYGLAPWDDTILLLEDVGERPYRLDRLVQQIRDAGMLRRCAACCWHVSRCDEPGGVLTAREVLADLFAGFPGPVVFGTPTGHVDGPALTLPLGVQARLVANTRRRLSSRKRRCRRPQARHAMKVHLIGICGTAMATLAALLKQRGFDVQGSDQGVYPPMSEFLASEGIRAFDGYDAAHITSDLSLVVVGNAISRGNPELEAVLVAQDPLLLASGGHSRALPVGRSFDGDCGHPREDHDDLAGWLGAHSAGTDPTVLIGGIARNFGDDGSSYRIGAGREFVIEGDEYDSAFFDKTAKFLKYLPDIAVVNNVEFDHADIYPDLDAVRQAFQRLVLLVPRNGLLLLGHDSEHALALKARAVSPVETFGFSEDADWAATT